MSSESFKTAGTECFKNGDFAGAIEQFTKAIELNGNDHTLYSNRSLAKTRIGDWEGSLADAEKVIELNPQFVKGYIRKMTALDVLGRHDELVGMLENAPQNVQSDSLFLQTFQPIQNKLMAAQFSRTFTEENIQMLYTNPQTAEIVKKRPELVDEFRALRTGDPSNFNINSFLGDQDKLMCFMVVSGQLENFQNATTTGDSSIEEEETPSEVHRGAAAAAAPTPTAQPVEEKKTELSENEEQALAAKEEGNVFYKNREFEKALERYNHAAELDPADLTFPMNIAAVLMAQKKYDEAIETIDKGTANCKKASLEQRARAIARKAGCYEALDDLEMAVKTYENALLESRVRAIVKKAADAKLKLKKRRQAALLDPVKAEEVKNQGNDAFRNGDFGKAIELYNDAHRRDPKSTAILSNRASAYQKVGDFVHALEDLNTCIELDPKLTKAFIKRARLQNLRGLYHKAMDDFQHASSLDPENQEAAIGLNETMQLISKRQMEGMSEEQINDLINKDPEIREILQDPVINNILSSIQANPNSLMEYMENPRVADSIRKLASAGILRMG